MSPVMTIITSQPVIWTATYITGVVTVVDMPNAWVAARSLTTNRFVAHWDCNRNSNRNWNMAGVMVVGILANYSVCMGSTIMWCAIKFHR